MLPQIHVGSTRCSQPANDAYEVLTWQSSWAGLGEVDGMQLALRLFHWRRSFLLPREMPRLFARRREVCDRVSSTFFDRSCKFPGPAHPCF